MFWNVDLHLLEKARVRSLTRVTVSNNVFFFCALEICFNTDKPTAVNRYTLLTLFYVGEILIYFSYLTLAVGELSCTSVTPI